MWMKKNKNTYHSPQSGLEVDSIVSKINTVNTNKNVEMSDLIDDDDVVDSLDENHYSNNVNNNNYYN
jgi:hypothetical protein